ncbi:hypothetical protein MNBD_GAMMA09-168 [hydrothermal vent metagenome]|uniref:RNA polymerase sigma factor 70 region 4 type 2 domain-containing protein n=1 Tax=hydrothermal vent metagenome TaxID=652676 RepID=A0A3B0YFG2_9ZZZZ
MLGWCLVKFARLAQQGETPALEALLERYRTSVQRYLLSHQYQIRINRFKDVYDLNIAAEESPGNTLMQQQQSKLLNNAIKKLPGKQRITLNLRIHRQLPFSRIAAVMQCSLSTAKANHYAGVKTVERIMAA